MGIFNDWTYAGDAGRPAFIGEPVEDIKAFNQEMSDRYWTNLQNYDTLEATISSLDPRDINQMYIKNALENTKNKLSSITQSGRWEDAAMLTRQAAKEFVNDPYVKGSMEDKAQFDNYKVKLDSLIKDGTISKKQADMLLDESNQANNKPIEVDENGAAKNIWSGLSETKEINIDAKLDEIMNKLTPDIITQKLRDANFGKLAQEVETGVKDARSAEVVRALLDSDPEVQRQLGLEYRMAQYDRKYKPYDSNEVLNLGARYNIKTDEEGNLYTITVDPKTGKETKDYSLFTTNGVNDPAKLDEYGKNLEYANIKNKYVDYGVAIGSYKQVEENIYSNDLAMIRARGAEDRATARFTYDYVNKTNEYSIPSATQVKPSVDFDYEKFADGLKTNITTLKDLKVKINAGTASETDKAEFNNLLRNTKNAIQIANGIDQTVANSEVGKANLRIIRDELKKAMPGSANEIDALSPKDLQQLAMKSMKGQTNPIGAFKSMAKSFVPFSDNFIDTKNVNLVTLGSALNNLADESDKVGRSNTYATGGTTLTNWEGDAVSQADIMFKDAVLASPGEFMIGDPENPSKQITLASYKDQLTNNGYTIISENPQYAYGSSNGQSKIEYGKPVYEKGKLVGYKDKQTIDLNLYTSPEMYRMATSNQLDRLAKSFYTQVDKQNRAGQDAVAGEYYAVYSNMMFGSAFQDAKTIMATTGLDYGEEIVVKTPYTDNTGQTYPIDAKIKRRSEALVNAGYSKYILLSTDKYTGLERVISEGDDATSIEQNFTKSIVGGIPYNTDKDFFMKSMSGSVSIKE